MSSQIWTFEYIRMEVGDAPPEILERLPMPKSEASQDTARTLLKDQFNDPNFIRKHGLKPEAVRILDDRGREVFRYTVPQLLTERPKAQDESDA